MIPSSTVAETKRPYLAEEILTTTSKSETLKTIFSTLTSLRCRLNRLLKLSKRMNKMKFSVRIQRRLRKSRRRSRRERRQVIKEMRIDED